MPKEKHISLREARQRAGLTQMELAEKAGVGFPMVQAIESGRGYGNLVHRHRLSDALGLPFRLLWPDSIKELEDLMDIMRRDARRERAARTKQARAQKKAARK